MYFNFFRSAYDSFLICLSPRTDHLTLSFIDWRLNLFQRIFAFYITLFTSNSSMTETSRDSSFALSDTYVDQVDIGLNPGDPLSSSPKNADEHILSPTVKLPCGTTDPINGTVKYNVTNV